MIKPLRLIKKIARYYQRFGFPGVLLLFKMVFKRNNPIRFSHREFPFPIFLRSKTSDLSTLEQVFIDCEYEMTHSLNPKVILDCGANIGLGTVYFKNQFPDAKIISIEPEESNFELLMKNTTHYNDIFCIKGGVWKRATNLLIDDVGLGHWGFMVSESETASIETVKGYTIDGIMKQFGLTHIDILKVDIEGSEKELFESNYEKWLPKTNLLIIELHDRLRKGCSKSFYKALSNYSYRSAKKGENIFVFMDLGKSESV